MQALHLSLATLFDRPPLDPQQMLIAAIGFGAAAGLLVGAWLRRGRPATPERRH